MIQGVVEAGQAAGVDVILNAHPRHPQTSSSGRAARWIRELIGNGRRAAIGITSELTDADLAALSRARLPLVVVDPIDIPQPDVTSVGSTNFAGGMAATQHLLSLGHRRIGYVGGPPTSGCNQARMSGFRSAMEAVGAPVPPEHIWLRDFLYDDGLAGGRRACSTCRTGRPRSSPAATRSRSASWKRLVRAVCAFPRTSAWSASTTPRWPGWRPRRSPP